MAYYFDEFGQYVEYETEEERKRREDFNNTAVQTQEIKTYGDGTVERITKEEMPGDYAPAIQDVGVQPVQEMPVQQPVAPIAQQQAVAQTAPPVQQPARQPVNPETFQRMIQAESGGRQNDPRTGQIMTSPKGALGVAQIMPSTAMQPGYGVPNIFDLAQQRGIQVANRDEATARQLLGNEQLNREFGQNYASAMTQRFGEQGGVAAYNAGPGRVGRNVQANAGQLNVGGLPQETQGYLQNVLGGQAQQAAPAMAQPAQTAAAVSPYSLATGQSGLGIQTGTAPVTEPAKQYIDNYQSIQDDPMKLMALRSDENAPAFIRERAGEQAYNLMNREVQTATATKQAQDLAQRAAAGDRRASNTIARELQNQDGSWLKFILLSYISPSMAAEEAVKLGYGNQWTTTTDAEGKSALIQVNAKGLPLKGYTADGNEIANNELVRYAAGGSAGKNLDIVGGTFVNDKTGEVGRMVTDKRTGKTQVQTDTGLKPMTGFRPQSSGGSLQQQAATQQQKLGINLVYEPAIAAASKGAATLAEFNAMNGTNFAIAGRDSLGMPLLVDQQSGQLLMKPPAAAGQAGTAQAGTTGQGQSAAEAAVAGSGGKMTPLATTPAPAVPQGQTPADIQSRREFDKAQKQKIAEAAGTVIAGSSGFLDKIDQVNEGITATTKKNNLGTIAQGVIPGERLLGKYVMSSADQRNTDKALNAVKVIATEGLKALGSQPTDADRNYLTANIPDETWADTDVREWLQSRRDYIKRKIDTAQKQVETGGTYVPPIPKDAETQTAQTAMSPADKARAEMEKRRKEKK